MGLCNGKTSLNATSNSKKETDTDNALKDQVHFSI